MAHHRSTAAGIDGLSWTMLDAVDELCFAAAADGELVAWNTQFEERLGYGVDSTDALHLLDIVAPDDREMLPPAGESPPEPTLIDLVTNEGEQVTHEIEWSIHRVEETGDRLRIGVARAVEDQRERELEQQRALLESMLNAIPDVVYAFDPTGEPIAPDFILEEFAGYSREELRELHPSELIAPEERESVGAAMASVLETGGVVRAEAPLVTSDGQRIPYEFHATRFERDGDVVGIVGSGRDVSERVERERALERQRDELAALADITELILDITRELLETPTRRDVERIVCERLAATDRYAFAWIGEQAMDGERLVARVVAGEDEGYVESITVGTDESEAGQGPGGRAWRTGEVQVARTDDEAFGPWRHTAEARDIQAVAAIPLRHGDTVYGVLGVYASSPDAFTDRKVEAFRVLGETVGFVTNAIKRRRLLFAESVVELSVALGESSSVLARLATALDRDVHLEGYLELEQRWVAYLVVEGATEDAILDALDDDGAVDGSRIIADDGSRARVETEVTASPLLDAAESVGASVREASATPDEARAVLEVPDAADVRETVELLTDALPQASVLAKQQRDRRPAGPGRPDNLLEDLTARQREALSVAFRAGYFDWPRESTAEEVAQTLEISRATLHAHLRKAQRTVLARLLGRPGDEAL